MLKLFSGVIVLCLLCSCATGFSAEAKSTSREPDKTAKKFYDPVAKELEGWQLKVDPKLLADKEMADRTFDALANHLQRIKYILPKEKVQVLQKLPIWIELNNTELASMQYHPDRGWLLANGHDSRLVKHVHLPRAASLTSPGMWAKHPYVVLHELAHAYHDQVLSFDHPKVLAAFNAAKEKKIYEKVMLYTGRTVRHYALSNHKEYFAEQTEAYLGVNDFYPFVRAELKKHDPQMFEVMIEIWGPIR